MSTISPQGHFLTFEGADGSGKTTQMKLLARRLRREGRQVVETVEPGGTSIGSSIRRILLDPANHHMSPVAEMMLYFAARAQNVYEIVTPATARGEIVVSDRWTDSTWAYQGYGRGLGVDVVRQLDAIACVGRKPDLTFWVDVDLEISLARAKRRNDAATATDTRMEEQSRAFFERVHEGYRQLALAEPQRFVRVDGSGSVDQVAARVWAAYRSFTEAARV
jgi:dTMP kinase